MSRVCGGARGGWIRNLGAQAARPAGTQISHAREIETFLGSCSERRKDEEAAMTCSCAPALAALAVEVLALRRELDELKGVARPCDDEVLAQAVAEATGGRAFNVGELIAFAGVEPAGKLARALAGMSARKIGKRLAALSGRPVGGIIISRLAKDRDGVVWNCSVAR